MICPPWFYYCAYILQGISVKIIVKMLQLFRFIILFQCFNAERLYSFLSDFLGGLQQVNVISLNYKHAAH